MGIKRKIFCWEVSPLAFVLLIIPLIMHVGFFFHHVVENGGLARIGG